jgi:hypothetical protein
MNAHRQSQQRIKLDRVVSEFFEGKSVRPSSESLYFGVTLSGETAALGWQGTMYGRRWSFMDLAEWSHDVLKIPGPPEGNHDQEVVWSVLANDELWGDKVPDMITYLLQEAIVAVHGKMRGAGIWRRVKEAVPHTADSSGMTWGFKTKNASAGLPWFPWPFECDVANLAIMAPPPGEIVRLFSYLKTRGAAEFLVAKLGKAYPNIQIGKRMRLKLARKILQDRLDEV